MNKTDLIIQLHEIECIQFGSFTMVSGLSSPIYIDLRRVMARPSLLKQVAQAYADMIHMLDFELLAAVPYAALTIGTAVSLSMDKPLIYPRKNAKTHGARREVEGIFSPGDKSIIIEDLVTKGGSVLRAVEVLERAGLTVTDVAVLIDREQGGRERLNNRHYKLHAYFTLSELVRILHLEDRITTDEVTMVLNSL
jgi:uridine monophosphate synthetase